MCVLSTFNLLPVSRGSKIVYYLATLVQFLLLDRSSFFNVALYNKLIAEGYRSIVLS